MPMNRLRTVSHESLSTSGYSQHIAQNHVVVLVSEDVLNCWDFTSLNRLSQMLPWCSKKELTYVPMMIPTRAVLEHTTAAVKRFRQYVQLRAIG